MLSLDRRGLMPWLDLAWRHSDARAPAVAARPPLRLLFTRTDGKRRYDAKAAFLALAVGTPLTRCVELDRRAIKSLDGAGRKRGYVARIDKSAVARMMDSGECVEVCVARLTPPLNIRATADWVLE